MAAIDYLMLLVYFGGVAAIGVWASRQGRDSSSDYFLGGRGIGWVAIGASLFANYCSQCHGSTATGARGFPNLTDDAWLYGGAPEQIKHSIVNGRNGVMPPLGAVFSDEDALTEMVSYVQSMQDGLDANSPAHTKYMTLCIACHGPTGAGNQALGAPSLIDRMGHQDNCIDFFERLKRFFDLQCLPKPR